MVQTPVEDAASKSPQKPASPSKAASKRSPSKAAPKRAGKATSSPPKTPTYVGIAMCFHRNKLKLFQLWLVARKRIRSALDLSRDAWDDAVVDAFVATVDISQWTQSPVQKTKRYVRTMCASSMLCGGGMLP